MRATVKMLAGTMFFGVVMSSGIASADVGIISTLAGASVVGQASSDSSRQRSDEYLKLARQAIRENKADLGEEYIIQAERLRVKYDPLLARFTYTPDRARRELGELRQRISSGKATTHDASAKDPFTQRRQQHSQQQPSQQPHSQPAASAETLVRDARRALASGDAARASSLAASAKAGVSGNSFHRDSVEKIERLVAQSRKFAAGPKRGENVVTFRHDHAQFLLEQAEALLRQNDNVLAGALVAQARGLGATYSPFERTPDQLAARLAGNAAPPAREPSKMPAAAAATAAATRQIRRLPRTAVRTNKAEAMRLVAMARVSLDRGDLEKARKLVTQAVALRVPDNQFKADETRPWQVALEINKQWNRRRGVSPAGASTGVNSLGGRYPVSPGVYNPANDRTKNVPAANQSNSGGPPAAAGSGEQLYSQGLQALQQGDRQTALKHFRDAWRFEAQLDPTTRQRLQDHLTALASAAPRALEAIAPSPLAKVDAEQDRLRQQLFREFTTEEAAAQQVRKKDPRGALNRVRRVRDIVARSELASSSKRQLLNLIDRSVNEYQSYIQQNMAEIELNEQNSSVRQAVERERRLDLLKQDKLASLVEEFNMLMDQQRYHEAEVIAKQAREIAPDSEIVTTLLWKSHFAVNIAANDNMREASRAGVIAALGNVERTAVPFDERILMEFGPAPEWQQLTTRRREQLRREGRQWSEAELAIQRALKEPVEVRFSQMPLAAVIETFSRAAGVNTHLDQQGLAEEGVTSDTPVTIQLSNPISLQSALNLILAELHLSYVIQDEVLLITTEQARDAKVYNETYYVADLVIPIPNFAAGYNIGMAGSLRAAHHALGYGGGGMGGPTPMMLGQNPAANLGTNASMLAQMRATGMVDSPYGPPPPHASGGGPGGLGGAALADFDSLIELITTTINPDSWDEVGGPGAISEFRNTLSLVVSQTQEVHDQITDLLAQLRRLQDLQVTIEVRFITLNDDFYERIGIDFDFQIDDNVPDPLNIPDDGGPSLSIGLDANGIPTSDLDIPFTQGSFVSTIPQFGGFDAASAANFGFAMLSDIDVFFLIQAAQGDNRSNILQAPKVTMFNGQLASVSDVNQRAFVQSVIPVVSDFAAAQQPVIVILDDGMRLSVQAVVSADRRFVRMTLVPVFSRIGNVETFTFDGSTTSNSGSTVVDPSDPNNTVTNNTTTTTSGTTIQLPTQQSTTVSTTVSVPDGGTVLLGGIKRLSEGRNELGVPMLSKIPYINRLFRNVGIGRTTSSLMMMVTPRIIIQEEEEEKLGIDLP